ncbi:MAG: chromate efflux transporter [Rhodobacteraceae bacterium]|jgi:chromate transporter|uniref:chromate efflux transporter n=1 Tax=Planktotalea sp. TaxID=2029877 RepID=UPI0001839C30|nr:chromate transporter [Rhodobacteraceae bacterium HTCC2083]MBT5822364.1 chromate efflux transporter [Paracoccaceae bacterium]HCW86270.1 chromate transporter [Paracoccaceae bacterium]
MTPLSDLVRTFGKIGCLSFGGPAAQIALMHKELVESRKWLSEQDFLSGLSFCMLLPGPEAMQLATYSGWRLRGTLGGLIAGLLFVLPGALVILALGAIYVAYGDVPVVQTLFLGVKAAVLAVVLEALIKVAKRAFKSSLHWALAIASFIAIFVFALPFPAVISVAALIGYLTTPKASHISTPRVPFSQTAMTILIWLTIWWAPILFLGLIIGQDFLFQLAIFFSKLATVTFGGAYAVLAFMGQEVVQNLNWVSADEMIDGLGLAETTPGPLILVTQFVGFLAGYNTGGTSLAVLAACVTLWATFVPCFLWIFAGAPYIALISAQPRLSGALSAITAAVVGVIANLSIWFALNVIFADVERANYGWVPDFVTLDWRTLVLSVVAAILLLRLNIGLLKVLAISALLALGVSLI